MRKILFLILFVSSGLFAQEEPKPEKSDYQKILIGISFSPDYSYRSLSGDGSSISEAIIDYRDEIETSKLGYTFGLNFNYNFNKRFGLIAGVSFSNKGYQSEVGNFIFGNQINPRRGFVAIAPNDPSIPKSVKNIYNYYYIDVPVKILFRIGNGGVRFISSLGVVTNVLLKSTVSNHVEYQNGDKEKTTRTSTSNFNIINISPTVSVGMEKIIRNKHSIRLEPTFSYGLLNNTNTPISEKLWSAGLNISYYFGLK